MLLKDNIYELVLYRMRIFLKRGYCYLLIVLGIFQFSESLFSQEIDFQYSDVDSINYYLQTVIPGLHKNEQKDKIDRIFENVHYLKDDTLKRVVYSNIITAYDNIDEVYNSSLVDKKIIALANKIGDSVGLGQSLLNLGFYYYQKDQLDSAYTYYYKADKIYDFLNNQKNSGIASLTMAIIQKEHRDYIGAEANSIKAIRKFLSINTVDSWGYLGYSYNNLGTISRGLENYTKAIEYFEITFEFYKKAKENNILNASGYNNIGLVYKDKGVYDSAIYYFKKGLIYDNLFEKRPKTYARLLDNLAHVRFLSGEQADYPNLFAKPLHIRDSIRDFSGLATSNFHLANYYHRVNIRDSANHYARTALRIAKSIPETREILKSLLLLTEISTPVEALTYSKEYIRISDSLQKVEKRFQDQFARIRFETDEKDASITQLRTTTQNQQTIIKQRNTISWVLGGLLLSFLGLGFLFYRQRQLQNKYVASNLEQRLLRSQLNPHFLFNALNAVSNLVQKKSEQTIPYISKLGQLLRSVLEHSREEFVSLEEKLETIKTYMELQSNFSKKFQYDLQVNEAIDKEALLIPPMFIQPFVENSIAHGFKGKEDEYIQIVVGIDKTNRTLHFKIEDNGIGYSKSLEIKDHKSGHQSLSGKILRERLSLYAKRFKSKASYTINDIDRGTKVDLYLPYLIDN